MLYFISLTQTIKAALWGAVKVNRPKPMWTTWHRKASSGPEFRHNTLNDPTNARSYSGENLEKSIWYRKIKTPTVLPKLWQLRGSRLLYPRVQHLSVYQAVPALQPWAMPTNKMVGKLPKWHIQTIYITNEDDNITRVCSISLILFIFMDITCRIRQKIHSPV